MVRKISMQHIGGLLQGWNFTVQIGALRLKEHIFIHEQIVSVYWHFFVAFHRHLLYQYIPNSYIIFQSERAFNNNLLKTQLYMLCHYSKERLVSGLRCYSPGWCISCREWADRLGLLRGGSLAPSHSALLGTAASWPYETHSYHNRQPSHSALLGTAVSHTRPTPTTTDSHLTQHCWVQLPAIRDPLLPQQTAISLSTAGYSCQPYETHSYHNRQPSHSALLGTAVSHTRPTPTTTDSHLTQHCWVQLSVGHTRPTPTTTDSHLTQHCWVQLSVGHTRPTPTTTDSHLLSTAGYSCQPYETHSYHNRQSSHSALLGTAVSHTRPTPTTTDSHLTQHCWVQLSAIQDPLLPQQTVISLSTAGYSCQLVIRDPLLPQQTAISLSTAGYSCQPYETHSYHNRQPSHSALLGTAASWPYETHSYHNRHPSHSALLGTAVSWPYETHSYHNRQSSHSALLGTAVSHTRPTPTTTEPSHSALLGTAVSHTRPTPTTTDSHLTQHCWVVPLAAYSCRTPIDTAV